MITKETDIFIVGAGPVGLACAYLAELSGLKTMIIDKSEGPLEVGRADALNARTLQLLEVADLFKELYPLGLPCNTSSIWEKGKFVSRQSYWWDELEGCFHKHFLMLGQAFVEKLLDEKLTLINAPVVRQTTLEDIQVTDEGCISTLSNGDVIKSDYLIGADGSHSFVRNYFNIPFEITRPQIVWAVIDAVFETDFTKVPEIIVFQSETSDVAWIPREGNIDRFYIRMDRKDFVIEDAMEKINFAMAPHTVKIKELIWFSQFSVKESVAENYLIQDRVILAGDACHIHSVNGGQGLNTGLADSFNLIWKLNMIKNHGADQSLLNLYETERKPVALSVIQSSGELVRSTKYSSSGTHAKDYVKIVEKRAGNITGMGIRYSENGMAGTRVYDIEVNQGEEKSQLYSLLDYTKFTLLYFGNQKIDLELPGFVKVIQIHSNDSQHGLWTESKYYKDQTILVRPDSYIESVGSLDQTDSLIKDLVRKYSKNSVSLAM
ncbi:FAD-binding protein [Aquimarina megaterium]|uniref:FAD-binding protein n=1 Tax=Aquimarina megaterium TaxID=1443666 RepID=UPI000472608A|nr:FAD-binding protein [Aquimarina megaterium]